MFKQLQNKKNGEKFYLINQLLQSSDEEKRRFLDSGQVSNKNGVEMQINLQLSSSLKSILEETTQDMIKTYLSNSFIFEGDNANHDGQGSDVINGCSVIEGILNNSVKFKDHKDYYFLQKTQIKIILLVLKKMYKSFNRIQYLSDQIDKIDFPKVTDFFKQDCIFDPIISILEQLPQTDEKDMRGIEEKLCNFRKEAQVYDYGILGFDQTRLKGLNQQLEVQLTQLDRQIKKIVSSLNSATYFDFNLRKKMLNSFQNPQITDKVKKQNNINSNGDTQSNLQRSSQDTFSVHQIAGCKCKKDYSNPNNQERQSNEGNNQQLQSNSDLDEELKEIGQFQ